MQDLLVLCAKYDNDFNKLKSECIFLTPFAVQIRYPSNTFDITEVETKKALEYAKTIIDFIKDKMKDKL